MSYLPNEENTFINIKLTDDGRRLLSLGRLTFDKGILSDREINYKIDGDYDIGCRNRIIAPKDSAPTFSNPNSFDGSAAFPIMVNSAKQNISRETPSIGFFSTGTTGSSISWEIDKDKLLHTGVLDYDDNFSSPNTKVIKLDSAITADTSGNLVYIPWEAAGGTGNTTNSLLSGTPLNSLWYRVVSADTGGTTGTTVYLDRPIPNFSAITPSNKVINVYFYPFDGVDKYYSMSGDANKPVEVWNMSIVRTSSVEGTDSSISGYTTYGSIQYNGTKHYLGFRDETRQIGIIHFTNEYTGNTYAEQLEEKTVVVDIPNIMWHNNSAPAGEGNTYGVKLEDKAGSTHFDSVSQTSYRELRDGSSINNVVGRVYHKLKMIVITDPELLAALTYKSNRIYTLPSLSVDSTSNPNSSCGSSPIDYSNTTGLLEDGYAYFVTYLTENSPNYMDGESYGYQKTIPCQYIQRIDGELDSSGNSKYLRATFNNASFPYLRSSTGMDGTGWNANKVQLLINKVDLNSNPGVDLDTIPSDGWKLISNSGIYTGATGHKTINPLNLLGHQFAVSKEDFMSGTSYTLDTIFRNNVSSSGLTFGDEAFFFGNIEANRMSTVYKTVMTVLAPTSEFNDSNNTSFNGGDTYITEIGVLNSDNVLVAVGKPTYPIKKNSSRYLSFQLEIDF